MFARHCLLRKSDIYIYIWTFRTNRLRPCRMEERYLNVDAKCSFRNVGMCVPDISTKILLAFRVSLSVLSSSLVKLGECSCFLRWVYVVPMVSIVRSKMFYGLQEAVLFLWDMHVHRYLWRARAEPCKVALYLLAHFCFFRNLCCCFPSLVAFRHVFVMTDSDDDGNNNSIQVFAIIVLIQQL